MIPAYAPSEIAQQSTPLSAKYLFECRHWRSVYLHRRKFGSAIMATRRRRQRRPAGRQGRARRGRHKKALRGGVQAERCRSAAFPGPCRDQATIGAMISMRPADRSGLPFIMPGYGRSTTAARMSRYGTRMIQAERKCNIWGPARTTLMQSPMCTALLAGR